MLVSVAFTAGAMALLVVALRIFRRIARRGPAEGNAARTIADAGEVAGVLLVAAAAAGSRAGDDVAVDVARVAAFGLAGLAAFLAASRLGNEVLLRGRVGGEIARGNAAAGIVAAAHSVGTAVVAAGLFYGPDWGTLGIACVSFVLAQASLHALVALFRLLTSYDDGAEILDANVAAALSYAGITIAVGVIIGHAADGPYAGFVASLREYGRAVLAGLALYPVRQVLVQGVILGARPALRGGALDLRIAQERDLGVGAMEACTYVATALAVGTLA